MKENVKVNKTIGENGAHYIISNCALSGHNQLMILTHCNTESLANSGYGTALEVIRTLHSIKRLEMIYCTETRPCNQGSRLTTFELIKEEISSNLICDNMIGALMKEQKTDAVIVGADRVAENGDTADKIGTYRIAIIAKYHNVLFFVASPISTIDFTIKTGKEISIEERQEEELNTISSVKIAPEAMRCWNPAFEVTPVSLITGGIITEKGIFRPNELNKLK